LSIEDTDVAEAVSFIRQHAKMPISEIADALAFPSVATNLENMAALYRKTGREEGATAIEKRLASIRETRQ
jgi:hypothetical protein